MQRNLSQPFFIRHMETYWGAWGNWKRQRNSMGERKNCIRERRIIWVLRICYSPEEIC